MVTSCRKVLAVSYKQRHYVHEEQVFQKMSHSLTVGRVIHASDSDNDTDGGISKSRFVILECSVVLVVAVMTWSMIMILFLPLCGMTAAAGTTTFVVVVVILQCGGRRQGVLNEQAPQSIGQQNLTVELLIEIGRMQCGTNQNARGRRFVVMLLWWHTARLCRLRLERE